jgi:hypothetical protein
VLRVILELISSPETDIVSALELKCWDGLLGKFEQDARVHNALNVLTKSSYEIKARTAASFLDDAWIASYLMKAVGRKQEADEARCNLLDHYDPFQSYNPVVRGLAYCEAIEEAYSVDQLLRTVNCMDKDIKDSQGPILQTMYCFLTKIAEVRLPYLQRSDYAVRILNQINSLITEGDDLARMWQLTEASDKYDRAAELAEYHLENYDLAQKIKSRLKDLEPELVNGVGDETAGDDDCVGMLEPEEQPEPQKPEQKPKKQRKRRFGKVLRRVFKKKKEE